MNLKRLNVLFAFAALSASAQTFDTSGNATLRGDYFVREVLMAGDTNGAVTFASSVIGVAKFDGAGKYAFTGQGTSLSGGVKTSLTLNGTYKVAANGLFTMQSIADPTDFQFGGVSGVGPSAFVASSTEGINVSFMIGIPASASVNNTAFRGAYTLGSIDFPNASPAAVRQATFNLTSDGAGNLGTVAVSGTGLNLGARSISQTVPGATYSLSGAGSGTISLGAAANSQLISGTKNFYISADGNIVIGGSPTGYDVVVGIRSVSGTSSNATQNGIFYLGGLEEVADPSGNAGNQIDAFYGSVNANGAGTSIFHNRVQSLASNVYDYTFSSAYTVQSNGTIAPSDIPYNFTLGANGQSFIATGTASGSFPTYSLTVGLAAQKYSGSGVYLNPLGVVSAANFAPITNPIAPNELIAIYGTGLATGNAQAQNLPLPTTLGGVQVTINGKAAPLVYVTPTQIAALVPSSISPDSNVYYAKVQVTNNGVSSNPVTVYTSTSAPGIFSLGNNAVGPAAAQHPNFSVVGVSNPARIGETITIYAGGLGAVSPAVPDGSPAPGSPLSSVTASLSLDFSGTAANTITFAGLTPTTSGLYQINVPIPAGTSSTAYINLSTPDALTSEATLNVAGGSAAVSRAVKPRAQRPLLTRKTTALTLRGQ